jgi:hypothetical protein
MSASIADHSIPFLEGLPCRQNVTNEPPDDHLSPEELIVKLCLLQLSERDWKRLGKILFQRD